MASPRPVGVTVMAVLAIVYSPVGMCAVALNLPIFMLDTATGTDEILHKPYLESDLLRHQMQASSVLGLFAAFALLAAGIGMLSLRRWARSLALAWATFSAVAGLANTVSMLTIYVPSLDRHLAEANSEMRQALRMGTLGATIGGGCFSLLLPIAFWIVLTRPTAKAAFGLGPPPGPTPPPPGLLS